MRTWDESKHKRDARGRFACQDAVTPKKIKDEIKRSKENESA